MFKQIMKTYKKSTNWIKILLFLAFLFIVVLAFKNIKSSDKVTEGFEQNDQFLFKSGNNFYDDFYD